MRLLGEQRDVEVRQRQMLGDVHAQAGLHLVGSGLVLVDGPVGRLDALGDAGELGLAGAVVDDLRPGEARECGDAVIEEQLPLIVADDDRDVRRGAVQRGGKRRDGGLAAGVLGVPRGAV